jgi:glycosyltransferase involved in cell wall biosynthesis
MLSSDRALFDPDSAVRARLIAQAKLVAALHVIVLTSRDERYHTFHIGNLTVRPTRSRGRIASLFDVLRIGRSILLSARLKKNWLITTQDPFEIGFLGYLLALRYHLPLHLQIHTDPWSLEWRHERLGNRVRFFLMRFVLHRASGIRVVSERVYQSVCAEKIPEERITRIPIFTDIHKWQSTKATLDLHKAYPSAGAIVLAIGRLQPEKNFHGLIRAFARVHALHDDALLIIVGAGPERERLLLLASTLGLARAVAILPWARDVVSYYKTADMYVQPSLYEGWGLAVVEAMASGCPVIMTDVGLAGEVLRDGENGLIVLPRDEESLADAISHMVAHPQLRKKIGERGARAVKMLPTIDETHALYKDSWERAVKNYDKN